MLHRAPRYQAYTDIHSASCLVRLQGHEMSATVVEGPFSSHDGNTFVYAELVICPLQSGDVVGCSMPCIAPFRPPSFGILKC